MYYYIIRRVYLVRSEQNFPFDVWLFIWFDFVSSAQNRGWIFILSEVTYVPWLNKSKFIYLKHFFFSTMTIGWKKVRGAWHPAVSYSNTIGANFLVSLLLEITVNILGSSPYPLPLFYWPMWAPLKSGRLSAGSTLRRQRYLNRCFSRGALSLSPCIGSSPILNATTFLNTNSRPWALDERRGYSCCETL